MEQVLERETVPAGYEDIVLYNDEGNRVTNIDTLRAIRESDEITSEWIAHKRRWNVE